jgi:hypothetical protein
VLAVENHPCGIADTDRKEAAGSGYQYPRPAVACADYVSVARRPDWLKITGNSATWHLLAGSNIIPIDIQTLEYAH